MSVIAGYLAGAARLPRGARAPVDAYRKRPDTTISSPASCSFRRDSQANAGQCRPTSIGQIPHCLCSTTKQRGHDASLHASFDSFPGPAHNDCILTARPDFAMFDINWRGLLLPLAYLMVLACTFITFSRVYRKRKACTCASLYPVPACDTQRAKRPARRLTFYSL
jgi:hypothetical protein